MGWTTVAWCEINPFCQKVLKHHFPHATAHSDITTTDFTIYRGRVDILTGGFPCQPYSLAGDQLGDQDERHLWPHMLRAIREVQPAWVVGENVRGFVSWNDGLVFEQVHLDLEAEGYKVQAYILPAAGVGFDHRRERVFVIAHSTQYRVQRDGSQPLQREPGLQVCTNSRSAQDQPVRPDESQHFYRGISDGIPTELYNQCIAGYGNAVVPQVVLQIFQAIEQYNNP